MNLTDERVAELNECIKTVESISSNTIKFEVDGDPFTKWDSQYSSIIKFNNGEEKITYGEKNLPSVRLHKIDNILRDWGFNLEYVGGSWKESFSYYLKGYKETISFTLEINTIHNTLFKLDNDKKFANCGVWWTYDESNLESVIDTIIENKLSKPGDESLKRELKLRKILK